MKGIQSVHRTTIAVGGIVLCDDKVLLVHRAAGDRVGDWQIPGGLVEPYESLYTAILRELYEETAIKAEVEGLAAILHRVLEEETNTYFVWLLRTDSLDVQVDGHEIDAAQFFTLTELLQLPQLQSLSELMAVSALTGKLKLMPIYTHSNIPLDEAILCSGVEANEAFEQLSTLLWYEPRNRREK